MENLTVLTLSQFCKTCGAGFSLGFFMGFLTYLIKTSRDVLKGAFTSYRG